MARTIAVLAVAIMSTVVASIAGAAEVKVLSAAVLKPALNELAPEFERASGHTLAISYESAGIVRKHVEAGEAADVVIISEPAAICQNIFLATEALGLGGWMHCGFLSLQMLETLGFRLVDRGAPPGWPNPVGLGGVFEGYCPPYHPTMDAAVEAALVRMSRVEPIVEISDAGLACTKAVCTYIHETFGRFPATVDTMHLMWLMQAHHLDLEFYDRFFGPGAYGPTHAAHVAAWHGAAES